jgi:monovalent cation:H+ antiporter, CPA1 family
LTFGVVAFSIVVQGLTIGPLIRLLRLSAANNEDEFALVRVRQIAVAARQAELEELFSTRIISPPIYKRLREELDGELAALHDKVEEMYSADSMRAEAELQTARLRLAAAEKSSIEAAVHGGLLTTHAAASLLDEVDQRLDGRLGAPEETGKKPGNGAS